MSSLVMVTVALAAQANIKDLLPERLQSFTEARTAETSQFDWTVEWLGGRDDGLVERFVTRTVGETTLQTNFGDSNGLHMVCYRKHPPSDLSWEEIRSYELPPEEDAGTRHSLVYEGELWRINRAEGPINGMILNEQNATDYVPFSFAAAGLSPFWLSETNSNVLGLRADQLEGFESAEWSHQRDADLDWISADFNGRRLEWFLDRQRGDSPIRAVYYVGDRTIYASETDVHEVDGRWVPTSIRFFRGESESPYKVIDVQQASFDKPEHAQEITPNDLGLLFGTHLGKEDGSHIWSGTELLSLEEYQELVYIYGVLPDPRILELRAENRGQTVEELIAYMQKSSAWMRREYYAEHGEAPWLSMKSTEKDEWDVYVEKFIKEHKLNEPRVKRAAEILKRAKQLRDAYTRKNITEIRKAERRNDKNKLALFDAHTERVFDRVLVRGLERLIPDSSKK